MLVPFQTPITKFKGGWAGGEPPKSTSQPCRAGPHRTIRTLSRHSKHPWRWQIGWQPPSDALCPGSPPSEAPPTDAASRRAARRWAWRASCLIAEGGRVKWAPICFFPQLVSLVHLGGATREDKHLFPTKGRKVRWRVGFVSHFAAMSRTSTSIRGAVQDLRNGWHGSSRAGPNALCGQAHFATLWAISLANHVADIGSKVGLVFLGVTTGSQPWTTTASKSQSRSKPPTRH